MCFLYNISSHVACLAFSMFICNSTMIVYTTNARSIRWSLDAAANFRYNELFKSHSHIYRYVRLYVRLNWMLFFRYNVEMRCRGSFSRHPRTVEVFLILKFTELLTLKKVSANQQHRFNIVFLCCWFLWSILIHSIYQLSNCHRTESPANEPSTCLLNTQCCQML